MSGRAARAWWRACASAGALAAVALPGARAGAGGARPMEEIAALIRGAAEGATVRVPPGVYEGTLTIDRPVTLDGGGGATLDGLGKGHIVEITAAGAGLRGFTVRGTGNQLHLEHAAVRALAGPVVVEDNRIEDALFGIDLSGAPGSVVRGNVIEGKALDLGRRGDGMRLWESGGTVVEGNTFVGGRDAVVWYSQGVRVRGNTARECRYGLHFMYSSDAVIEGNDLSDNSVGVYIMYSKDIEVARNRLTGNRGPSGYGIGLKDADNIACRENMIAANRVGVYADGSPLSLDAFGVFEGNVIAYNEAGLAFAPSTRGNVVHGNAFVENQEQAAVLGRGDFKGNEFVRDGRGNYWSDYAGFDRDGDGIGDLPYESVSLFESLMEREPKLRLFLYSPAQQAIELTSRALPEIQPEARFTDPSPLTAPPALRTARGEGGRAWEFAVAAVVMAGAGGLGAFGPWLASRRAGRRLGGLLAREGER